MVDLARELIPSLNSRKRKADAEECSSPSPPEPSSSSDPIPTSTSQAAPRVSPNAPRQPSSASWFASNAGSQVWPRSPTDTTSPSLPQGNDGRPSSKRPRLEIIPTLTRPSRPSPRRSPRNHASSSNKIIPRDCFSRRPRRDENATFPKPNVDPQFPLLPTDASTVTPLKPHLPFPPTIPSVRIDPNSPHIPSLHPLINRQTLKELDLDAILRHPQLRHDLLFDPGLQFRPTASRRKNELTEAYWRAVIRELETGCTCVSFDMSGTPHSLMCSCLQVPLPSLTPVLAFSTSHTVVTLRMPSRLRALLTEFLEVLLTVIQPLSRISGLYINPNTFQSQMHMHAAQAAHLRSVFNPDLILQELRHNLFDPSGVFRAVGDILKSHCAPMRDAAVNCFVEIAQSCAPGGNGGKVEAVKALRMCLEILELMKLDIANHQLQSLRPVLVRTSGQFELKAFRVRQGDKASLQITRQWLQAAHRDLLLSGHRIPHTSFPSGVLNYLGLQRNQKVYISALKGFTDLIFTPPFHASRTPPSLPSSPISPTSPISPSSINPLPGYPETTYLDNARLSHLSKDATETTAIYMFLMLYRQLIFTDSTNNQATPPCDQLTQLKKEIRDIGSSQLAFCFACGNSDKGEGTIDGKESSRWREAKQNIVLQVVTRAMEASKSKANPPALLVDDDRPFQPRVPDERLLKLAENWADSNMHADSTLTTLLRNRLRDAVFNAMVAASHTSGSVNGNVAGIDLGSPGSSCHAPAAMASGMEPLAEEIRSLAERISRLAHIHLTTYLALYEQDGFLDS